MAIVYASICFTGSYYFQNHMWCVVCTIACSNIIWQSLVEIEHCSITYFDYRIAGNFRVHKFSRITNKHVRKKIRFFFIFATKSRYLTTPPTIFRMEMVILSMYVNIKTSKILARLSKRVGHCRWRTAMPKGSIRSCGDDRRVIVGRKNFRSLLDAWIT